MRESENTFLDMRDPSINISKEYIMRVNNLFPSEVPRKERKGRGGMEPETWVAASRFDLSFPSSRHFWGASLNSPGQVSISVSAPLTSLGPEKQKLELKNFNQFISILTY